MARIYIGNVVGPQGATGATGATGPAGAAATVDVGSVSTTAYGNPASVVNSGTTSAAVLDFVIPQGQPGAEVTDMSGLILGTMTDSVAEYPVPQVNDNGATLFGKIKKYLSDLKAKKLDTTSVVNNLTTTDSGYALDARQGKALNDAKLAKASVVNNLTTTQEGYALDAREGKALNDRIDAKMSNVAMSRLSATGSSTSDVLTTSSGGQRHILFALDSTANNCGAWFVFSNNSNVLNYKEIAAASAMTLTRSGASLTIAHNAGSIFYLDITLVGGTFLELTYS